MHNESKNLIRQQKKVIVITRREAVMVIKQEDEEIYGRTVWGFFLKVGGSSGQCISRFANETIKSKGGRGEREWAGTVSQHAHL